MKTSTVARARNRTSDPAELIGKPIEAIVALASNPNRRRVCVGGRTATTLWVNEIDELGLEVGGSWTARVAAAVDEVVKRSAARQVAMRMLGRRALSIAALRERLIHKGHSPEIVDRVMAQLRADGWLNDEALGDSIAHTITARAPAGRRLIEARLKARGIREETAERVAMKLAGAQDDVKEATKLAHTRLKALRGFDRRTIVRRLSGLLARRGFDEQTIEAALGGLGLLDPE